jgi:hypothetical protein
MMTLAGDARITREEDEVEEAKWMPLVDFIALPLTQRFFYPIRVRARARSLVGVAAPPR